jgi:hypothetical protein
LLKVLAFAESQGAARYSSDGALRHKGEERSGLMSIELWKTIFDWAAVILVGLTFIAGAGGLITGKILNDKQAGELKQFQLELAEANDRASHADLKRVELQNRIADIFGPRQLTTEQSARIATSLAGLRGVKIDVYVLAVGNPYSAEDSKDSESIGRTVVRTLGGPPAFMDVEGWLLEDCNGAGASNLVVSVRLPGDDADRKTATRVLKALQPEIGTDPEISDQPPPFCTKFSDLEKSRPNKRKHDAAISVIIGRKINPLLTREMLEPVDEQRKP